MKCQLQYKATDFQRRALRILVENPGLTASQFALLRWPVEKRKFTGRSWNLLAAIMLKHAINAGLVFCRFVPPFWVAGRIKPRKKYYVSDKGYTVNEFYRRYEQAESARTSDVDREGGPGDGADPFRRAHPHAGHPEQGADAA